MPDEKPTPDAATLAGGAVELVRTVYPDLAQPAAKEVGRALETVGGVLNMVLRPIRSLTAATNTIHDRIDGWLTAALKARAPHGRFVEPPPHIAGPALMALVWSADQEELRRLYVNLLASSMIEGIRDTVHPAFVSILQQMTPSEARLIAHLAGGPALRISRLHEASGSTTSHRYLLRLGPHWPSEAEIQNLLRLQLIAIDHDKEASDDDSYAPLEAWFQTAADDWDQSQQDVAEDERTTLSAERCLVDVTDFGVSFRDVCVADEEWSF